MDHTAGSKLDDRRVATLRSYMSSLGVAGIGTASAGDDTEPAFDPGPVGCTPPCNGGHTYEFLVGYDQEDDATGATHILWDYGSNEAGWWTNDMEWYAAYGDVPQHDFGQVYTLGMAQDWENLAYWADTAGGGYRGFWVSGVTNQYPACVLGVCYKPQQSYNAMLSKLDYAGTSSPTYQSRIDYITNI